MKIVDLIFKVSTSAIKSAQTELKKLEKDTKDAEKAADKLDKSLDSLGKVGGPIGDVASRVSDLKGNLASVSTVAARMPYLFVAIAGAAGVVAAVRFAELLDDLGDLAAKLGTSTTQALLLKQELEDAGVSNEAFTAGLQRAANALSKADEEGKAAAEALKTLGINAQETTTPQQLLTELTEEYTQKLKDGTITTDEMAALQLVLGRNYRETMIATEAAAAAQERYNEFTSLGIGISKDGEEASSNWSNANKDLQYILNVVGSQLVSEIVPAFTKLINALVDSYKNSGLVKVAFLAIRGAAQVVMVPIRALFNAFIQLDAAITTVGKSLGALFAAIATRSTEPLKMLKADIAEIWKTAESRMSDPWSWDSGAIAPQQNGMDVGGGIKSTRTSIGNPKAAKDAQTVQGWSAYSSWGDAGRREIEYAAEQARKLAEETRKATQAADEYIKSITAGADPINALVEEQLRLEQIMREFPELADRAFAAWNIVTDKINQQMSKTKEKTEEVNLGLESTKFVAGEVGNAISGAFNGADFSFRNFLANILRGIAQMIIQLKIVEPLMKSVSMWASGGFGSSGSFWTYLVGAFGGARANGGPVSPSSSYLVGERGPEIFVPNTAGRIVPNHAIGSQNISIVVNVEGGSDAQETGSIVSRRVAETMKNIARQEIAMSQRQRAYAA